MRIAIDARAIGPHFPGIGRATLGLLRGLHEVEHDHQILVLHRPAERALLEATGVARDARFALASVAAAPLGISQQWRVPRVARTSRTAVWHAPYYLRPFWGLPPAVVTVFDAIGPGVPWATSEQAGLRSAGRRLLWRYAMRLSLRSAAHVITSSHAALQDLQADHSVPMRAVSVIPLAADDQFRPPPPEAVARLRRTLDLPDRYVLYLGSNKPHKNLEALLEAWGGLVRDPESEVGNMCLVIAGREDPRYRAARVRSAELGLGSHIRFLPDVREVNLPPLLGGACCFVFPSLREGFGLPPLEAMACGTPVVAANRTSLPEVIGDAGLLVEPDPAGLAAGIRRLLGDAALRRELRERGLRRAAGFSWKRTATETLRVYHQVAG